MPWLALGLLAAIFAIVFVTAIRFANHRRERFREAWRAFAASRGWTWVQASGPWYRSPSDALEGSVDGVPVRVDTYVVSTGKSATTFTRVIAKLTNPVPRKIVATRRTILTAIAERFGRGSIDSGDAGFDRRFALRSKERAAALALFDARTRERARTIERCVSIQVKGSEVKLTWHGSETDPAMLDATCGTAAALVLAQGT